MQRCGTLLLGSLRLISFLLAFALGLSACDGGGHNQDKSTAPPKPSATTITTQPASQSVLAGALATFNVIATNATGYQWQRSTDGGSSYIDVDGATAVSYTTPVTALSDSGTHYRVIVSGVSNSVTSAVAILTVTDDSLPPAAITTQPDSQSVVAGATATFSVIATNATGYQWQRSTDSGSSYSDVDGATAASYTTPVTALSDSGTRFRVIVSGVSNTVTSAAATLTVTGVSTPAAAITAPPASQSVVAGATATFTVVAINATDYQWQRSTDGGSSYSDIDGATAASYTTPVTALSDSGTRYRVIVSGVSNSVTSAVAILTVTDGSLPPAAITTSPASQSVVAGATATFTVIATNVTGYQWQRSTDGGASYSDLGGATAASYTTPVTALSDSGTRYRVIVSGISNSVTSASALLTVTGTGDLPPDPIDVAPPIAPADSANLLATTAFLYTGSNPIQTGVAPDTIDVKRIAVLRGKVLNRDDSVLSGVTISVLGHPELGQTLSREDGLFDIAVNGGGTLTVRYEKAGFLPSQRAIVTPWQDYAWLPDVVLVPLDSAVTTINLNTATPQVARGSIVTDSDGTRQATVFFPAGTTASLVLPGGGTQSITTLNVRATEYTVGENGPRAMPALLPATSAYTYAVDLSVDEAIAAGADQVTFSQPIPVYVENFLDFPVGIPVPLGYYDRQLGQWIAEDSGVVIKVLSTSGGSASLDIDGDDSPDNTSSIGISSQELQRLATLYTAGQTLWRVTVDHFSPWDMNWGFGPPEDAIEPNLRNNNPDIPNNKRCGSVISCESQSLGQVIPVTGTPFSMHYNSDQVSQAPNVLNVPLVGDSYPSSLKRVDLLITVAGKTLSTSFSPQANLSYSYTFDGNDAYGRPVGGRQKVRVQVGYTYDGVYKRTERFGYNGNGTAVSANRERSEVSFWLRYNTQVGALRSRALNLFGWSLDVQHAYAHESREFLLGTGERRSAGRPIIKTVAGDGSIGSYPNSGPPPGDGGPAVDAKLRDFNGMAVGPDGSIYFAQLSHYVRRVSPDGIISTVAGAGVYQEGVSGDGEPAAGVYVEPQGLAVAPDGSLYFSDNTMSRIRKVSPDGIISTVAGTIRGAVSTGDGGLATQAQLLYPSKVALAPDGTLYLTEPYRIRRVGTDGIITTVVGDGTRDVGNDCGKNNPAIDPVDVAVHPDGSLYYVVQLGFTIASICKLGIDGTISQIAGGGSVPYWDFTDMTLAKEAGFWGVRGLVISPDGMVYFGHHEREIYRIDNSGYLVKVAGGDTTGFTGDGGPAEEALLYDPNQFAVDSKGALIIGDQGNRRVRFIEANSLNFFPQESGTQVASPDGREVYIFDSNSRHTQTREAFTGAVRYSFNYDDEGYLADIIDASGNVTSVERIGSVPSAIIAPGGQRTSLLTDGTGFLAAVSNPASEAYSLNYNEAGLLSSYTEPTGVEHSFEYDAVGRLHKDIGPVSSLTLERIDHGTGSTVTATTAMGRRHLYQVEQPSSGGLRSTVTDPSGAQTTTVYRYNGDTVITYPNGSTLLYELQPDPRWGSSAAYPRSITATTLGGRTRTITTSRQLSLTDAADPWSLSQYTETTTENGVSSSIRFEADTRQWTRTSRTGRASTITLDALGRTISYNLDSAIDATELDYNDIGRLATVSRGGVVKTLSYNANQRLSSVQDGNGRQTNFDYDLADRVAELTLPSGRSYQFAYDANGRTTEVTMPDGQTHRRNYNASGKDASYTPPGSADSLAWSYDDDGAWIETNLFNSDILAASYDEGGRPSGRDYPDVTVAFGYGDSTNRIRSIQRDPGSGSAQNIALNYDAELVTSATWSGASNGTFNYSYDNRTLLSGITGTANIAYTRDNDGLVTKQGPFTYARSGSLGAVNRISDGTLETNISYNATGRIAQRGFSVNGTTVYQAVLSYDDANRISRRIETIDGSTRTLDYGYDADGQLTSVTQGGNVLESYNYDLNGNRTSNAASYDDQDRLRSLADVVYSYDLNGMLQQRGLDSFSYSVRGELLNATVGTNTVNYSYDGLGRRISRQVGNSNATEYLYGNPANPLQLTASRSPAGVLSVYYYDQRGMLLAILQGSTYYYVASNEIGTPLVVTNASGTIIKQLSYDSYGVLLFDSNPAFELPIGFAGGLGDAVTGLVRFGYRDYAPSAGRWTVRDPALYNGLQFNLYGYVGNDPVNHTDPTGLFGVGVSAYDVLGGGIRLTIDSTGFKICGELGVGIGASLELDPLEEVGDVSTKVKLIGEVSLGPIGAGLELGSSGGCLTLDPSVKLGPVKAKFEGKSGDFTGTEESNFDFDLNAEAKLAEQFCGGMLW
jgi:RHS repeat-associated protein